MKTKKCVVVGYGTVGQALVSALEDCEGLDLHQVVRRDGVYDADLRKVGDRVVPDKKKMDILFLCIPSVGDGRIAYEYIKLFAEAGISVVTCEKGAVSNFYPELCEHTKRVKWDATVGAVGSMLPIIHKNRKRVYRIQMILNGTLNYLWQGMSQGVSFEEMVRAARAKGFLEPGGKDDRLSIVSNELDDVFKKMIIVFNTLDRGPHLRYSQMKVPYFPGEEIADLIAFAPDYRPYVEINLERTDCLTHHLRTYRARKWYLYVGFAQLGDITRKEGTTARVPSLDIQTMPGEFNSLFLTTSDGRTLSCHGPGAGVEATVETMIRNAEKLLSLRPTFS